MTAAHPRNWQEIEEEILNRILSRRWQPGQLIPTEVELAKEFGCARATVNRALQSVAGQGWLDRKRRAGTTVAVNPVRKATLHIPVIREEVESPGRAYSYELISQSGSIPPEEVRAKLKIAAEVHAVHVLALHLADGKPYAYENRWINPLAVPNVRDVSFARQNANEWLIQNAPFTHCDFTFRAINATSAVASVLRAETDEALFAAERTTRFEGQVITHVMLVYHAGYAMRMKI